MVSFETKTELRKSESLDYFWLLSDSGETIIQSTVLNCPRVWKGSRMAYYHSSDLKVTANHVVGLYLGADLKTNPRTSGRRLTSHSWILFLLILPSSREVCHIESSGTFDVCLSKVTLMP